MSKETKVKEEVEEIADAKAGAVATVQAGAVSAQVNVRGASIRFATMAPFYGTSAVTQECAQECREGDWYVKTGKTSSWRLAGSGKANAVKAFVVDAKEGVLEGAKQFGDQIPRSWSVGRPHQTESGVVTPKNLEECVRLAMAETKGSIPFYRFEDYNRKTNPIPLHYLARSVYLEVLVEIPDTFPGDVPLYKIGGAAYSPVRVLLKKFDPIKVEDFFRNIKVKEDVIHRGDKDWVWSPFGQCISLSSVGAEYTKANNTKGYIWVPTVAPMMTDKGVLYVPDAEEKADLAQFAKSLADIGDVGDGEFE